jgi:hypothetical protein
MHHSEVEKSVISKGCILLLCLVLVHVAAVRDTHLWQASISGRVFDVSGSPYPAKVQVFQIAIQEGFASLYSRCETNTNQEGVFSCPKHPGGKFIVQVLPQHQFAKQTPKP